MHVCVTTESRVTATNDPTILYTNFLQRCDSPPHIDPKLTPSGAVRCDPAQTQRCFRGLTIRGYLNLIQSKAIVVRRRRKKKKNTAHEDP